LARQIPTVLTMADLRSICNRPQPKSYAVSGVISALRPGFTLSLRGSTLCFRMDTGEKRWYRFEADGLSFSTDGLNYRREYAECLESSVPGVTLIHHLHTGESVCSASTIVFDASNGLVTLVSDTLGTVYANRDVNRKVLFGELEGANTAQRHSLTDELTGKVIDWKYAHDVVIHQLYENRSCCAFVSPPPAAAPDWKVFYSTFNPTKYVKIRDGLFLLSFYAPGSSGMEVSMLMDLHAMKQVGAAFGIDLTDTLRSYTFGAIGAWADPAFLGRYTIE
jgi:hypothetical protein